MNRIVVGDRVRPLTHDEYNKTPARFRNAINYDLLLWTRGHDKLIVKGIKECAFGCGGHEVCSMERLDLGYAGMDTMCGGIYKKKYTWKKL